MCIYMYIYVTKAESPTGGNHRGSTFSSPLEMKSR